MTIDFPNFKFNEDEPTLYRMLHYALRFALSRQLLPKISALKDLTINFGRVYTHLARGGNRGGVSVCVGGGKIDKIF